MHLRAITQPYIFPGLNGRAIDFLTKQGNWFTCDLPGVEEGGGLIIDEDRFTEEDPYSAITGIYVHDKALVTRTQRVVTTGIDEITMALYKYKLNDGTWVIEEIDQLIEEIRPALCLMNEYGDKSFQWTEQEVDEAIQFMIETGILQ